MTLNLLLASVYAEIDPIGHEKSIRGVFDYARQCDSWIGVPPFLEQQWSHFLDVIDDAQAVASAWRFLQLADEVDSDHYRAGALLLLCKLLHYREPEIARAMLSDLATEAEVCARNKKNDRYFAMALMWRAVAARVRNDESAACELYHRAWTIQERLTTPQNVVNEGAMAYHEFAGETESSLRVCRAELRVAVEHGLIFGATVLRFKECQLLQQLNCPYAAEAQQLRLGAAQLPGRAHWEAKLGALERTA